MAGILLGGLLAAVALFPAPGAREVPPDAPLRLRLDPAEAARPAGSIQIVDTADGAVADALSLHPEIAVKAIGGLPGYRYHTVLLAGSVATVIPHEGVLRYGRTYAVHAPGTGDWTFATRRQPPPAGSARLVVASDGQGDFCTLQGAVDFIPAGNEQPRTVLLRRGLYTEMVFFTGKHGLTIEGEDRSGCVLAYDTNDRFNPATGNPFAAAPPDPGAQPVRGGHIYHRGVFLAHRVRRLTLRHLTIRNTTPHGGSQAEALILNGGPDADARLEEVDLSSCQDTLQINGPARLRHCRFEGDVDFLWGIGPCFFEDCTATSVRSNAFFTQVRNPPGAHGFVFLRCVFTGLPGVRDNYLSRIQPARFPGSEVVLLDCTLSGAVGRPGWFLQPTAGLIGDTSRLHFWEAGSHDPAGHPVDVSRRLPASRQLTEAATLARYRSPEFVLGTR